MYSENGITASHWNCLVKLSFSSSSHNGINEMLPHPSDTPLIASIHRPTDRSLYFLSCLIVLKSDILSVVFIVVYINF